MIISILILLSCTNNKSPQKEDSNQIRQTSHFSLKEDNSNALMKSNEVRDDQSASVATEALEEKTEPFYIDNDINEEDIVITQQLEDQDSLIAKIEPLESLEVAYAEQIFKQIVEADANKWKKAKRTDDQYMDVIKLIINKLTSCVDNSNRSFLSYFINNKYIFNAILERFPDIVYHVDGFGRTILHFICYYNKTEVFQILEAEDLNIDMKRINIPKNDGLYPIDVMRVKGGYIYNKLNEIVEVDNIQED